MDANKVVKLKEIGYKIAPACGLCIFSNLEDDWGTCGKHTYMHGKHYPRSERQLSINRYGSCKDFVFNKNLAGELHGFKEFLLP